MSLTEGVAKLAGLMRRAGLPESLGYLDDLMTQEQEQAQHERHQRPTTSGGDRKPSEPVQDRAGIRGIVWAATPIRERGQGSEPDHGGDVGPLGTPGTSPG